MKITLLFRQINCKWGAFLSHGCTRIRVLIMTQMHNLEMAYFYGLKVLPAQVLINIKRVFAVDFLNDLYGGMNLTSNYHLDSSVIRGRMNQIMYCKLRPRLCAVSRKKIVVFFFHIINLLLNNWFTHDGWILASFSFSRVNGFFCRVNKLIWSTPKIYENMSNRF